MPSAFDRVDFAPPAQPGMLRAMGLAILAHLLLAAALTWGVSWKSQSASLGTAQAELWSSVPQQAAPRAALPPPASTPPPEPTPKPVPEPKPTPPAPPTKAPDIVDKQDKPPKKPVEKPLEKPPEPAKAEPAKPDPAIAKREAVKEAQRKAAEDTAQREKDRQDAINRSLRQAGSGVPEATGTAPQSSGNLSGAGARGGSATASDGDAIANIIKQNTSARSEFDKSLKTTFDIRISGSGQILSIRMVKSSGNPAWDEAALRGIERTRENGGIPGAIAARVPPTFPVNVSP
jgi:colicin import membrane protein